MDSEPYIENDGIAGAFSLAKCLIHQKKTVAILMDKHCEDIMKKIFAE